MPYVIFYRVLLNFIHLLFSFYLKLQFLKCFLFRACYSIGNINKLNAYRRESVLIRNVVKKYSKLPKHLVLILGEDGVSYDDLVLFIVWNMLAGVCILSFYDHKNELNASTLHERFIQCYGEEINNVKWGISFSQDITNVIDDSDAGKWKIHVNIYDNKYSRQLLINSIQELNKKTDMVLKDRRLTESALDDLMFAKMGYCGKPDLLVISGNVCTTYGLSPWHIGFSEFQTVCSYRLLTVYDYLDILKSYADCEQKFGR